MTDEEALAEAERIEREEHELAEYIAQAHAAWRDRWPGHCRSCGGWGGGPFYQSHPYGAGSATETLSQPCQALSLEICHRCGEPGLDPKSGNGPCRRCGWDYDDGVTVIGTGAEMEGAR